MLFNKVNMYILPVLFASVIFGQHLNLQTDIFLLTLFLLMLLIDGMKVNKL